MKTRKPAVTRPYFSICIPQYNRTSFLLKALESVARQSYKNIEICISDDCSTDGRSGEVINFLEKSGIPFTYEKQTVNKRYDANLRAAIGLAEGEYCFLMGNDDALFSEKSLEELHRAMRQSAGIGIAISNYQDYSSGKPYRRISRTGILGSGPAVAASNFRNFSFVSGILLETKSAKDFMTDKWDGSEMYQMYLGCRMIAAGKALMGFDQPLIRMGIRMEGESVDSYAAKPVLKPCPIISRKLPLNDLGRLAFDAIEPYLEQGLKQAYIRKIFSQIFCFTYFFWIFEYRRVQSWKYAVGICLGMSPKNTLLGIKQTIYTKNYLRMIYSVTTFLGLFVPRGIFFFTYPFLYRAAKRT